MPPFPPPTQQPHVKICGLTRAEDALLALELGAAFLGVILTTKSKRHVPRERATELMGAVRAEMPAARFVGVFVDEPPELIAELYEELNLFAVQVHGAVEPLAGLLAPEAVVPALAIRSGADGEALGRALAAHGTALADAFAEGAHGGTGKVFDHRHVQPHFAGGRVLIAGGLGPHNIAEVVERLDGNLPYAFDLSSGVEQTAGVKSPELMRAFFANYRRAMNL